MENDIWKIDSYKQAITTIEMCGTPCPQRSLQTKVTRAAYKLDLLAYDSLRITLMKSIGRRTLHSHGLLSARLATLLSALLIAILLSSTAFAWQGGAATATKPPNTTTPASTLTEAERKATGRIKLETIREITTKLSSKEFEGRGTGQPGADKAAAYLADLFKEFGSRPPATMEVPPADQIPKR